MREAVIQKILYVARLSPIIRFDAAMTLAKQHYQRLWYPVPGTGGAIPSRAEHGLTKPEFDRAFPQEFWREVVDRCAAEAPGTLLLAEAFWLLEGYFVRTLGMHRVYNSAFMNMLRDEENANYRSVIKNTIEFDPEILKRYVNFMNNPDERTAVDQFGRGEKYFGVCTLMATLPGLPMFGHGQVEGFTERYGMEYRRAYHDESPDPWLVSHHEQQISPLLHRRALFADVRNFLLYDLYTDFGSVNENVFAYSNSLGDERALVIFNNKYAAARGWIRVSSAFAEKHAGGRILRQRTLADALALSPDDSQFLAARDTVTGLEHLYSGSELAEKGMRVELGAYQCRAFLDWKHLRDDANHPWRELYHQLQGRGVPSLADAMRELQLRPVHVAFAAVLERQIIDTAFPTVAPERASSDGAGRGKVEEETSQPERAQSRESVESLAALTSRFENVLHAALRLSSAESAEMLGVPPSSEWHGSFEQARKSFAKELSAAARIPQLENYFAAPWTTAACQVLPSRAGKHDSAQWATVVAWAAVHSLGELLDPIDPAQAGSRLLDAMKLRQPMADAFSQFGLQGEDRWRAAARVRVLLANQAWLPGAERSARSPYSWLHDPDVAWLINVHEYEGVRYFNKENYECLLWWMALPALLRVSESPTTDAKAIADLEAQLNSRMDAAERAAYQVMSLFELGAEREQSTPQPGRTVGSQQLHDGEEEPAHKRK